jgi:hypothetical protein
MTVQRHYTLPNCNLVLEGLNADASDPLSPMAVLMNVECYLPGATDASLTGGREFLDSLVAAVSRYAQQLISGVEHPRTALGAEPPLVEMKSGDGPYHHLIVRQQTPGQPLQDSEARAPLDVKLTTVQFYDLLEAIDQLLADSQTLPDLQPQLQAISRRSVKPAEPVAKRAAPAAIGAAALAAAGIGLFFVPVPDFEPSRSGQESEATIDEVDGAATPGSPSQDETTPEDQSSSSTTDPDGSPAVDAAAAGLDRLADAPAIADPELLQTLQQNLRRRLAADWTPDPVPDNSWTYRVAVAENGDVLGYKYQDTAALENVATTPLARLAFDPVDETEPVQEPVAQFEVSFTPEGAVEVVPWGATADALDEPSSESEEDDETALVGDTPEPSAAEAEATENTQAVAAGDLSPLDNKITDGETIRSLNSALYDSILAELDPLSANEALEYQVRMNEDGDIVGFEPLNAAGVLLADETPLPDLVTPAAGSDLQADYRVVFTEAGVLEVSPWDGWPD